MNIKDYQALWDKISAMETKEFVATARTLAMTDLYFLGRYVLNRKDLENQWLLDRCNEVKENPNNFLDLWAREHYKSTIITFFLTIQNILNDPEITIGIFSHTRPIAKKFLQQIKVEFENNEMLKLLFPDILYSDPRKESLKWSEDEGITVKRRSNPKEATVEAWGLVDGQPTSKHYKVLIYDDVVTEKSVTDDMIKKTTHNMRLSFNLGARGGVKRFIGTRYHFNDSYRTIITNNIATPRIYPATKDGEVEGEPVLLTREELAKKRREQGPYIFACQMMQNPNADETQGFLEEWLRWFDYNGHDGMNTYILVDPAGEKKKTSDYTTIWTIGLGADGNIYQLDYIRDRLNLTQRARAVFNLHRKFKPKAVAYEKYGKDSDIEHLEEKMKTDNYRFEITAVGGSQQKNDRIKRLIPYFETGKIYLQRTMFKTDYQGLVKDINSEFIEQEYKAFPVPVHDDGLDALSRLCDLQLTYPLGYDDTDDYGSSNTGEYDWMTA